MSNPTDKQQFEIRINQLLNRIRLGLGTLANQSDWRREIGSLQAKIAG